MHCGLLGVWAAAGCTAHKDLQYFSVVDELGNQAFYRVRIEGASALTDYKLQSGNYSAAAVEVIRGQMPDIVELSLDVEHERVFDETVSLYHQKLLDQGYSMVPDASARARWLAVMEKVDASKKDFLAAADVGKRLAELNVALGAADTEWKTKKDGLDAFKLDDKLAASKKESDEKESTQKDAEAAFTAKSKTHATEFEKLKKTREDLEKAKKDNKTELVKTLEEQEKTQAESVKAAQKELDDAQKVFNDRTKDAATARAAVEKATRDANLEYRKLMDDELVLRSKRLKAEAELDALRATAPNAERLMEERCSHLKQHAADAARIAGESGEVIALDFSTLDCTKPDTLLKLLATIDRSPPAPPKEVAQPLPFGGPNDPGTIDQSLVQLSRLVWYASLSKADLVAMGQNQTNDPNAFRKHVFWVTAKNIKWDQFGADIERTIGTVVSIARASKEQANLRSAEREGKRKLLDNLLSSGVGGVGPNAAGLVDVLLPTTGAGTPVTDALGKLRQMRDEFSRTGAGTGGGR